LLCSADQPIDDGKNVTIKESSSFEKNFIKLNEGISTKKIGLRHKQSDNWLVKVPKVNIHEINAFGLIHMIFSTQMYPRLKNETNDVDGKTRRLDTLEDPLNII
jgi:hypothetical protein